MRIIYAGKDITQSVLVSACRHAAYAGGRADCLEITFENPGAWYAWSPETDDPIEVTQGAYTTGRMYLNAVIPKDGGFTLLATGMKCRAREKKSACYENRSLESLVGQLAEECGMQGGLYGIAGELRYPFLLQNEESAPALLSRLMGMEGAVLKASGGKLYGVSLEGIQKEDAALNIRLSAGQDGMSHVQRRDKQVKGLTVSGCGIRGAAEDTDAQTQRERERGGYSLSDAAHAARWARGMLLTHNLPTDSITLDTALDPRTDALTRVDVSGVTPLAGAWLCGEVIHDFVSETTRTVLWRCRSGVR